MNWHLRHRYGIFNEGLSSLYVPRESMQPVACKHFYGQSILVTHINGLITIWWYVHT